MAKILTLIERIKDIFINAAKTPPSSGIALSVPLNSNQIDDEEFMRSFREKNGLGPEYDGKNVLIIKFYPGSFRTSSCEESRTVTKALSPAELEAYEKQQGQLMERGQSIISLENTTGEKIISQLSAAICKYVLDQEEMVLEQYKAPRKEWDTGPIKVRINGIEQDPEDVFDIIQVTPGYTVTVHYISDDYQTSPSDPKPYKTWMFSDQKDIETRLPEMVSFLIDKGVNFGQVLELPPPEQ